MDIKEFANLKVGDKVRITNTDKGIGYFVPSMKKYLGTVMTVKEPINVSSIGYVIRLKEDDDNWGWTAEMIECKVEERPTIVEHLIKGNKVIVKLSNGKVGVAACSPEDKFDEYEGLKLAIDRAYGKVPGFKKESKKGEKKSETKVREVSRPAKVGEWIKIIPSKFVTCGVYKPGDILKVYKVDLNCSGVYCELEKKKYNVHNHNGNLFIANPEYVVLEGYEPEPKVKEVKRKAKVGEWIKIIEDSCILNSLRKGKLLKVYKIETTHFPGVYCELLDKVRNPYRNDKGNLIILDGSYVVLEGYEPEPKVKAVKRKAKVGEYVKIVEPFMTCGLYKKDDILLVVEEPGLCLAKGFVRCDMPHAIPFAVKDSEYVVLENYKPKKQ